MKIYIHLTGTKERFRTLLSILQLEQDKKIFILTDSDRQARIIGRKLDLNCISNSSQPKITERIIVNATYFPFENFEILLVYFTNFENREAFNQSLEKWKNGHFSKIIILLSEKLTSFFTESELFLEYLFLDENNLPEDRSSGLSFVLPD
jgi:5S rRNA maturation endonuclease (ribonuclease M5)